ncbi:MAG: type IV pilin N-terminal domain-containing protein [Methanoregula sp.]|jgi:FlaG/FlaF family flagellin (archaellin)
MHYQKRVSRKNGDAGVSPVVGVMLMLVVTIIIAAVVSAFSGSTISGTSKAPSATAEFHIKNGGSDSTSYFSMKVLGVSEPIPTRNLQLMTSWSKTDSSTGNTITGHSTSSGTLLAYNLTGDIVKETLAFNVPTGYGNGVTNWSNDTYHTPEAEWGQFSLTSGTSTFDRPLGYSGYSCSSTSKPDPMQAILGTNWCNLRSGDTVSVRIIDTRSGKTVVDQNVIVEG